MSRHGWVWRGVAGEAWPGVARRGMDWRGRHGGATQVKDWHGEDWQGRRGVAVIGKERQNMEETVSPFDTRHLPQMQETFGKQWVPHARMANRLRSRMGTLRSLRTCRPTE
jgi:hypothetical protein